MLERTGYTLDVTTGQRKYGGPPPESVHSGAQPTIGTEVKQKKLSPFYVLQLWVKCIQFSYGVQMMKVLSSVVTIVTVIVYR